MNAPSNFNQPNTPQFGDNKNDSTKRMLTIAAVAIALLLGTNIFQLVRGYQLGQKNDTVVRELDTKEQALAELETRFNDASQQLEQLKGSNAELNAKIDEQVKQLEEQKGQIAAGIKATGDLKRARAEINSLVKQKDAFVVELADLKEKVASLTTVNTKLTTDNQQLSSNLNDTKSKLDEESTAKAALISEKTKLESTNQVLGKKVDVASAIKVSNVVVKPVAIKSSGKEKEKKSASKVQKLNICFTTEANDVADAGEEKFHIRIIDPTGAPLAIESLGSGVDRDKKKDSEFRYTCIATSNYTNSVTEVCGFWQPGQGFMKGKYGVEVYNKGYLVGTGEFKLK